MGLEIEWRRSSQYAWVLSCGPAMIGSIEGRKGGWLYKVHFYVHPDPDWWGNTVPVEYVTLEAAGEALLRNYTAYLATQVEKAIIEGPTR